MPCVDLDRSPRNLALGVPGPDGVSLQRSGYRHGQGLAGINASALSTSPAPPQAISHNAYYVNTNKDGVQLSHGRLCPPGANLYPFPHQSVSFSAITMYPKIRESLDIDTRRWSLQG